MSALAAVLALSVHAGAVDLHAHLTMRKGLPFLTDFYGRQFTEDGYAQAGVSLVVAALWVPPPRVGQTAFEALEQQVRAMERFTLEHPRFAVVRDVDEARRVMRSGRIAVFLSIEGADALETPAQVDAAWALGVRMISLAHLVDTALLDAEDGQLSPFPPGGESGANGSPLTPLGRAIVDRALSLGMRIDVTHASPAAVEALLEVHEARCVPLVASHAGSGMHLTRTLTDDHARRIAALGGLVGIGLYRHPLLQPVPADARIPGHVPGSCDDALSHARHYATLVGAEQVVLGSDLGAPILRGLPSPRCPRGIVDDRDLATLFEALTALGLPQDGAAERFLGLLQPIAPSRCQEPK